MAGANFLDENHNIIYVKSSIGPRWIDNDTAKYVMGKVVDEARLAIKNVATTMKLSSLAGAIAALESKEGLNKLFNEFLGTKIPDANTVYSFKVEIDMNGCDNKRDKYAEAVRMFEEAYVDNFDKDDELATLLLKSMSGALRKKTVE